MQHVLPHINTLQVSKKDVSTFLHVETLIRITFFNFLNYHPRRL